MDQDQDKAAPAVTPEPQGASAPETAPAETTQSSTRSASSGDQHDTHHVVDSEYTKRDVKIPRDKQKSKTASVVKVILATLVVAFGAVALWFFAYYNNPDKAIADAVMHFYQADNVVFDGGISLLPDSDDTPIKLVTLDLDLSSTHLPLSTEAALMVVFNESAETNTDLIKLKLGLVWLTDGAIYLQLGGLHDTIASVDLTSDQREALQTYIDTFEQIDNEWWRISVPELVDEFELPGNYGDMFNDMYSCVISSLEDNDIDYLAPLYREHAFLTAKPVNRFDDLTGDGFSEPASGYNGYGITIDTTQLAEFINSSYGQGINDELFTCLNRVSREHGFEEIDFEQYELSADDIELPEDFHLYAEVSRFGHELRSLTAKWRGANYTVNAGVLLKYDDVIVNAPESYRPITELTDALIEAFVELNGALETIESDTYYDDPELEERVALWD